MALDTKIKNLAQIIFEAIHEIKGHNILMLNLEDVQSYADLIFIASGNNIRQVQAIADNLQKRVFEKLKRHPLGTEGYENAQWILIDFGDVICHIFLEDSRHLYHLEDLWPQVEPIAEKDIAALLKKTAAPKKAKKASPPKKRNSKKTAAVKKRGKKLLS